MATLLGSLLVSLGLDSGQFSSGLTGAQKELKKAQKQIEMTGAKIATAGAKLTAAITAPLLGVGAAFVSSARDMAASVPEIEKLAQLSGVGFEQFQRLSYAAKSVGFEADKMGDIFKDVNDKVGDFFQTGGGPMKDFFDQIAPKVGVTADAFRNLSGPQALQLYYNSLKKAGVSQAEMTFYLEAIANDATALIPLLQDNGKAFDELGAKAAVIKPEDAAGFKAYTEATRAMEQSMRKLTIAVVNSGLLDAMTNIVEKVADFTKRLSEASPATLKMGIAIMGIASAVGPAALAFGAIVKHMAPFLAKVQVLGAAEGAGSLPMLTRALVPFAVAVAGVYIAYRNWDKIGPWIDGVVDRTSKAIDRIDGKLSEINKAADEVDRRLGVPSEQVFQQSIIDAFKGGIAAADAFLLRMQADALRIDATLTRFTASFQAMQLDIVHNMRLLYTGVKTWVVDRLNAVWKSVTDRIEAVKRGFFDLYDAVVGHSYIPDMVDEIGQNMRRLDTEMVDPARAAISKTENEFKALRDRLAPLMERLFPDEARIAQFRRDYADLTNPGNGYNQSQRDEAAKRLGRELGDDTFGKDNSIGDFIGANSGDIGGDDWLKRMQGEVGQTLDDFAAKAQRSTAAVVEGFANMARDVAGSLQGLVSSIKNGDWLSALSGVLDLVGQVSGLIGGGGRSATPVFNRGFGGFRAAGGPVVGGKSYVVGENGPEIFNPGRSGSIVPNHMLGGSSLVRIVPSEYFDAVVDQRAGAVAAPLATAAAGVGITAQQRAATRGRYQLR